MDPGYFADPPDSALIKGPRAAGLGLQYHERLVLQLHDTATC